MEVQSTRGAELELYRHRLVNRSRHLGQPRRKRRKEGKEALQSWEPQPLQRSQVLEADVEAQTGAVEAVAAKHCD